MTVYVPEATPATGNVKLWVVVTIASLTAPKVATEIGAATSVDASQYIYSNSWAPALDQGKGQARRRVGTKRNQERLNTPVETLPNLEYVFNPQLPDTDPINKLYAALTPGAIVHFVERLGMDTDAAAAAGQYGNVYKVRLGERSTLAPTDDENADIYVTQGLINTIPVTRRAIFAA